MQHKFAPEAEESLAFHEAFDTAVGRLLDAGCVVALTADHGMNGKNTPDGAPNVIYVESLLQEEFGTGCKVVCPITDPYVVHHGALGSLVMVHLDDLSIAPKVAARLMQEPGITEVHDRATAALKLELASDRIGDLVVLCGRNFVVGKSPEHHDLSVLKGGLRSHGGRYEEMVPLVISKPLNEELMREAQGDPRNFDVFHFACHV
jgi:phosphonoacetate hydrolase